MHPNLGRRVTALVLCFAIGAALCLSGCQGARSTSGNTLAHPEPTTKAERRGDAYLKTGSYKGALQEYDRALAEGASSKVVNWRKGNAYFSARQWEKAFEHFQKAIDEEPDWALAQEGAGFAAFEMGEFRNALGYFERSTELVPDNWVPYAFLAVIHRVLGNNAASKEASQKALSLSEENKVLADATMRRAYTKAVVVLEEQGDAPESAKAASGREGPLGRLESLAAAEPETETAGSDEDTESSGGWKVVEKKQLPGQILGMNGTATANATAKATRAANATANATGAAQTAATEPQESEDRVSAEPMAAKPAPEPAADAAPAANGTIEIASTATTNATNGTGATNGTRASGLTMSEEGTVTVIESPGFQEMGGLLAGADANGTLDNATEDRTAAAAVSPDMAPDGEHEQDAALQADAEEPAPARSGVQSEESPAPEAATAAAQPTAPDEAAEPKPSAPEPALADSKQTAPARNATETAEQAEQAKKPAATAAPSTEPQQAQKPAAVPQVAGAGKVYAVLESSWRAEQDAVKRIAALEKQGVRAHLVPSEVEGKGFWYRVMIGPRKKLQAVKEIKVELQQRFGLTGMVILMVPESKF